MVHLLDLLVVVLLVDVQQGRQEGAELALVAELDHQGLDSGFFLVLQSFHSVV